MDKNKEWLFQENVRLNKLAEDLERREKHLKEEKQMFEQQKKTLEIGFLKLAADKEAFEAEIRKEKALLEDLKYEAEDPSAAKEAHRFLGPGFFCGVNGTNSLRKRYKELLKIYHPDNKYGDAFTVACINKEYELLKDKFSSRKTKAE